VVEELKVELPGLVRFSTLSPVPGFRRWLEKRLAGKDTSDILHNKEMAVAQEASKAAAGDGGVAGPLRGLLTAERWWDDTACADALRGPLTRLCATYLTTPTERRGPADPVARFHLGNGARLERVKVPGWRLVVWILGG